MTGIIITSSIAYPEDTTRPAKSKQDAFTPSKWLRTRQNLYHPDMEGLSRSVVYEHTSLVFKFVVYTECPIPRIFHRYHSADWPRISPRPKRTSRLGCRVLG